MSFSATVPADAEKTNERDPSCVDAEANNGDDTARLDEEPAFSFMVPLVFK